MAEGKGLSREYYSHQLEHYMDVRELESWLAGAAARKEQPLPTKVWQKLKAAREAKRKAAAMKWLRDETEPEGAPRGGNGYE